MRRISFVGIVLLSAMLCVAAAISCWQCATTSIRYCHDEVVQADIEEEPTGLLSAIFDISEEENFGKSDTDQKDESFKSKEKEDSFNSSEALALGSAGLFLSLYGSCVPEDLPLFSDTHGELNSPPPEIAA